MKKLSKEQKDGLKWIEPVYTRDQLDAIQKSSMQVSLDYIVENDSFDGRIGNLYGKLILNYMEALVNKLALHNTMDRFDIEYIVKPFIIDMLLVKAKFYDKTKMTAISFVSMVARRAVSDAKKKSRLAARGLAKDVFYIDDVKKYDLVEEVDVTMFMENPEIIKQLKNK